MADLLEHPTVKKFKEDSNSCTNATTDKKLDTKWLRNLCLEHGANDVGFVEIEREEIADHAKEILTIFPFTKTIVSFVCILNRDNIRVPARSVANVEMNLVDKHINNVARKIVASLNKDGVRGVNPAAGFPMEMNRWPEKTWIMSHKPITVAAGLGKMGFHRSVIHPKHGSFILLGSVLIDAKLTSYSKPIHYNPCLGCKLCSAVCPTGAISSDGYFNFTNCLTHSYRELLGGFIDWTENLVKSKNKKDYRSKVSDAESVSMWQSLAYGGNYKSVYCIAVCPAGEDVVGQFITDPKRFSKDIVKPLQNKKETIYVVPDSDAEDHVTSRFPNKEAKKVGNGLRPDSISGFLEALPLVFQRSQSNGIDTTYHFTFTGNETRKATVIIRSRSVKVQIEHKGKPDVHIIADSTTWLKFLAKEKSIVWALLSRKIRIKGPIRLLSAFGKCFPS